jgi:CBS domain-containing protein
MKIKDVMIKKVITLKSGMTLKQAAEILVKNNISGAPVVNKNGKLIGVISEKDLFRALYPNFRDIISDIRLLLSRNKIKHRIEEKKKIIIDKIMTEKTFVIDENDPALKAGSLMLVERIHRIPVVGKNKLVGIVSRRDIFRKILKTDLKI